MESLKYSREGGRSTLRRKFQLRRPWCIALGVAVAIVIILVIVIPLAVILPRRGGKGKPSTVLFPLYIYPESNSTWDPLYEALDTHPDLDFVVIVNPHSGPGSSPSPSQQYQVAINRLATYPNVQTVGYVRTTYGDRNISEVIEDVAKYSDWHAQSAALAMDGIFFDESPHQYSSQKGEYIRQINQAVKDASGLQKDRMVIHNPGTIPDARYEDSNTDVTVVFEQSYDWYQSTEKDLAALDAGRSTYAYVVHSVPSMGNDRLESFVRDLSKQAAYLFLTTRDESYYEYFDPQLAEFCDVVPT